MKDGFGHDNGRYLTTLILDTETTTFQKGNPFAKRNSLCYIGTYPEGGSIYVGSPDILPTVGQQILSASIVVGFNLKFDLHWIRRAGYSGSYRRVWDCQLAHFLLTGQTERYPSLNSVLAYYELPPKDDRITTEYWDKGIDTPDIPQDEILSYLTTDLLRTRAVYDRQVKDFESLPKLFRLFQLGCQDLLVLAEMEWNGLKLDVAKATQKASDVYAKLEHIETALNSLYPHLSINWDSGDDVSCVLYGGTLTRESREIVGVYKTGQKVGFPRYRINKEEYILTRLVEPIEGSELKKAGYWSIDESVLKQLKGQKSLIANLLERSKLMKELDYYEGLPKLIIEKDWDGEILHGQLNQCVAATGRLSASQPNQQNLSDGIKECIVSRYES